MALLNTTNFLTNGSVRNTQRRQFFVDSPAFSLLQHERIVRDGQFIDPVPSEAILHCRGGWLCRIWQSKGHFNNSNRAERFVDVETIVAVVQKMNVICVCFCLLNRSVA